MKKSKIIAICLCVILVVGAVVLLGMGSMGMPGFYHPLNEPKEGQIRVACVGDSLTYGYTIPNWKTNNYPAQLAEMLGDGYCVNNYGNTGHTVSPEGDKPYTAKSLYQKSLDFNPDIVIIMLGSNDAKPSNWQSKEYFKEEYKKIIESYLALDSQPTVYVGLPTQIFEVNGKILYGFDADLIDGDIKDAAIEIAQELNLATIDVNAALRDRVDLFGKDGAHPNAQGAKVFAQTVYDALQV